MDTIQKILDSLGAFFEPILSFLTRALIAGFPFINTFIILVAGLIGAQLYGKPTPYVRGLIRKALGIAVLLFGISELWDSLIVLKEGQLEAEGSLLAVVALLIGWLFGEALMLDKLLGRLGILLTRFFTPGPTPAEIAKAKKTPPTPELLAVENQKLRDCADGFIIATVLCSFSSLLFTQYMDGRMNSDPIPLLIKLGFDLVLILTLATLYGNGVSLACIPTLVMELLLWLVDTLWGETVFTPALLGQISIVGSVILLIGGVCMIHGKRFRAANFIPALFIPVVYTLVVTGVEDAVKDSLEKK